MAEKPNPKRKPPKAKDPHSLLVNATDAAKLIGVSRPTFYKHVAKLLPKVTGFGDTLYERVAVAALVSKNLERPSDK